MKKFIALFLVFFLLVLSGNLIAKERRGAELIVQKTDGQQLRGELIAVKKDSLLLLSDFWTDVSVDIKDVKAIRIVRKSKALIGLLAGGAFGELLGLAITDPGDFPLYIPPLLFAGVGAILGTLAGAAAGADEKIQIEGKSDAEIKEVLEKLRKKARVRNFQ